VEDHRVPGRKFLRITDDVTLRSEDEIQMFVSPVTACFIYIAR
jgi:hypothetical protein